MKRLQQLVALLLIASLAACGDSDNPVPGDLQIEIRMLDKFGLPSHAFVQGEEITLELTITNLTTEEQPFSTADGQVFDFQITNRANEIEWFWSFNRAFTQAVRYAVLNASEVQTITTTWDQTVDVDKNTILMGDYLLEGWFIGAPDVIATTTVSIL
jgi:hypothetical protein